MPLRAIVRLVAFVLLVVLAVCGLAIAVFAIGGSRSGDFNLPGLARLVHLGDLRDQVGSCVLSEDDLGRVARHEMDDRRQEEHHEQYD